MRTILLIPSLALALAAGAGAADPAPAPPGTADRDIQALSEQLRDATGKIADLQKRLETVEDRLGETYRPATPFDSVERRLDDLEKDVDDLKRH